MTAGPFVPPDGEDPAPDRLLIGLTRAQMIARLGRLGYLPSVAAGAVTDGTHVLARHVVTRQYDTGTHTITAREPGPEVLTATCYGDDITGLVASALEQARVLYGEAAPVRVEQVSLIHTSVSSRGRFTAKITLHCTALPEGLLP